MEPLDCPAGYALVTAENYPGGFLLFVNSLKVSNFLRRFAFAMRNT